jgi:UDP-N-acetylglucosamine--N-acetylmuramyl-(pentapeptide) pyrophosphoryl-undecaprenol N-acetylglucosamine transferase
MKILFAGGGTAGHIFPIIAIVRQIKKRNPRVGFEFFYLGPKDSFSRNLFVKEGVKINFILAGKLRRYFSILNIVDILKIPIGILQAFYYIFVISPDMIFSKGGYGSIPTIIAAKILAVPIFLHESDVVPGIASKFTSKSALEVFISFSIKDTEYFPAKKMLSVGNPIREDLLDGTRDEAKKIFKLVKGKPLLLVLGGSQGSEKINDTFLVILPELLKEFEVIHQTGVNNFEENRKEADVVIPKDLRVYYHPIAFLDEKQLASAYKVADLIISRSGSGSIFEIAANAKPSILVPLANSAQDHQVRNAYTYSGKGSSLVIEEGNFKPYFIMSRIKYLFSQPEKLRVMSERAKDFSRPNAAGIIAEYLTTYLTQ